MVMTLASLLWNQWQSKRNVERYHQALEIGAENPRRALEILSELKLPEELEEQAELHRLDWLTKLGRVDDILLSYNGKPEILFLHEGAAQLASQAFVSAGHLTGARKLLDHWQEKGQRPAEWYGLKADILVKEGDLSKLKDFLLNNPLEGDRDAVRLMRLAMIAKSPDDAWDLLEQARSIAPKNPDVRTFRAQLLEGRGKKGAALFEYRAAYELDPTNPQRLLRLSEFYLRQHNYGLALSTYDSLPKEAPESYRYRFYSAVVRANPDKPEFWSDSDGPGGRLHWHQVWLRTLQFLKDGDFGAAELAFQAMRAERAIEPELVWALDRVFALRQGKMSVASEPPVTPDFATVHRFYSELSKEDLSEEFLQSDHVFSALFLSHGWLEAGLRLPHPEVVPSSYPEWLGFALAQALRQNRGPESALAFIEKNPKAQGIQVLKAELLLGLGKNDEALKILKTLSTGTSPESLRACYLLTFWALDSNDFELAQRTLRENPSFAETTVGVELRANLALAQKDLKKATKLYRSVLSESTQAKIFLAKQAYSKKDWAEAERLSVEALEQHPETPVLWKNLESIRQAKAKEARD